MQPARRRRAGLLSALAALLLAAPTAAQTDTPTETPTATATGTVTVTATATVAPTAADTTGNCRATGDKEHLASDTVLTTSPKQILALPIVVPDAADPWFFLANVVVFNQSNAPAQVTVTMSEAAGLFDPQVKLFDVAGPGTFTYQVPFQTWRIAPGDYTLRVSVATNRRNVIVAQTESYLGAWRLGSSSAGCPGGGGGLGFSVCLTETVATAAAATVSTDANSTTPPGGELPAPAVLFGCFARVTAAITGGFRLGLAGAPAMFGSVSGTVDSTNEADPTLPRPVQMVSEQPVILTSTHASGSFQNTAGRAEITCYCSQLGAPTE